MGLLTYITSTEFESIKHILPQDYIYISVYNNYICECDSRIYKFIKIAIGRNAELNHSAKIVISNLEMKRAFMCIE